MGVEVQASTPTDFEASRPSLQFLTVTAAQSISLPIVIAIVHLLSGGAAGSISISIIRTSIFMLMKDRRRRRRSVTEECDVLH